MSRHGSMKEENLDIYAASRLLSCTINLHELDSDHNFIETIVFGEENTE